MNLIPVGLPRHTLVINVGIAALAAVGITAVAGAQSQAVLGIPILTALFTFALLAGAREAEGRTEWEVVEETTDPVTGLATEAVAQEALIREFAAAQRGRPLTVVMVRLEALGKYRALHGQAVGDQLVRVAARTLLRHRRDMHVAARHGARDGTFLSILSGSDRDGAGVYAARLRGDLMRINGLPPHEGVSIGIASFEVSMSSPGDLLRNATYALEKGSEAGGKVMIVGERH